MCLAVEMLVGLHGLTKMWRKKHVPVACGAGAGDRTPGACAGAFWRCCWRWRRRRLGGAGAAASMQACSDTPGDAVFAVAAWAACGTSFIAPTFPSGSAAGCDRASASGCTHTGCPAAATVSSKAGNGERAGCCEGDSACACSRAGSDVARDTGRFSGATCSTRSAR